MDKYIKQARNYAKLLGGNRPISPSEISAIAEGLKILAESDDHQDDALAVEDDQQPSQSPLADSD